MSFYKAYHEPWTRSFEQATGSHKNTPLLAMICIALPCDVDALPLNFTDPRIEDSCLIMTATSNPLKSFVPRC